VGVAGCAATPPAPPPVSRRRAALRLQWFYVWQMLSNKEKQGRADEGRGSLEGRGARENERRGLEDGSPERERYVRSKLACVFGVFYVTSY
jgi:hypothetical protein